MTLPDRFLRGPKQARLAAYIARKYSTTGIPSNMASEYNPEHVPTAAATVTSLQGLRQ